MTPPEIEIWGSVDTSPLTICTLAPETWIVGLPPTPEATNLRQAAQLGIGSSAWASSATFSLLRVVIGFIRNTLSATSI